MKQCYVIQSQRPVGQGGFHLGRFVEIRWTEDEDAEHTSEFNWAYDCGSNQLDALHREIDATPLEGLDILFLSHLDSDHVSGVDHLLATTPVAEVVLPYLQDDDWVLHLAAEVSRGTLSGSFVDLVDNPEGWFARRGVRRLTYIDGPSDDDDPEGFDITPDDPDRLTARKIKEDLTEGIVWTTPPREIASPQKAPNQAEGDIQVRLVEAGSLVAIVRDGQTVNWVLSPFACRLSQLKLAEFKKRLAIEFIGNLTTKQYAALARRADGREKLRRCYNAVWKDHNLHSMALYSGPWLKDNILSQVETYWRHRRLIQPGWISTGDFEGNVMRRRKALLKYYAKYAALVGTMNLPHHGADLSFHPDLLSAFSNLSLAVANVGPNTYGHPGQSVQAIVAGTAGVDFVRVDQNPNYDLTTHCVFP